jgi:hypothetical protein
MKGFNETLFKCINETVVGVMGDVGLEGLYLDLLSKSSLTREQLPDHLENLLATLEENFGSGPTRVISTAIARRLYSELNIAFTAKPDFGLTGYVAEVKTILLKSSTSSKPNLKEEVQHDSNQIKT